MRLYLRTKDVPLVEKALRAYKIFLYTRGKAKSRGNSCTNGQAQDASHWKVWSWQE